MVKSSMNPAAGGRHQHCDTCYDAHCKAPSQSSLSCSVAECPESCGAAFHLCKRDEHQRLCPNRTVPCINAAYGCPLTMPRRRRAKHLEVCAASVVCCSQEWNRWPASEKDLTFYRNVSAEPPPPPLELDVAAALRDQDALFRSIKMKDVFPELMKREEEPAGNVCEVNGAAEKQGGTGKAEGGGVVGTAPAASVQDCASWEETFEKEIGGREETVKNTAEGKGKKRADLEAANCREARRNRNQENSSVDGATGLAPWQDGVLERLGREVNVADYNMYLVHHGAMLIDFGQLAACTPRDKDFVYGSLEPVEVQTVRTFKVPSSYRAKRVFLKDPAGRAATAHKSADTGDLASALLLPMSDEVSAALLCSLEKELRGHVVSESASVDGFYVDVGTQTYDFASAPFEPGASLADVVAGRPRRLLHMRAETESVTRRHNRRSSAFSFACGRFFRRDEYRSHFGNAHADVQASLGGWLQQRCPLAYLGCTYAQTRLRPAGHPAAVVKFCPDAGAFVLQPRVPSPLLCVARRNLDPLSALPIEILRQVAAHLDSVSLSQLSRVSRLMRDLCATLLPERGMVSLEWKKKTYSHGGSSWKCRKKVWEFSSLFSPVDTWSLGDAPSMSEHLKLCSFYHRQERSEPVELPGLREVRDRRGDAR